MNNSTPSTDQYSAAGGVYRHLMAARRYFTLVGQLGSELFKQFPADTIKIFLASAISLACQVLAVALLFAYMKSLEGNELLLGYPPRDSMTLFAAVAISTVVLFFAFALLEYRSNIAILGLCRRYQNAGTREILLLSSKLPHWFTPESDAGVSARHLRQILSVDVHHRSRMARVLMRAVIPAVRLALSALALLYINPQFSALVFFIIGVPLTGLYYVGKRIADTITSREIQTSPVFQKQLDLLSKNWDARTHISQEEIDWDLALGETDSRARLYFRRLRAKALGQLLINTANTLGIMMLVLSLGLWILQQQQGNWSLWITYLIALRFFLTSLNRVAQAVIQSTRFNRQVRRFLEFNAAARSATDQPDPLAVPCPDHVLEAYQGKFTGLSEDDFEDD